MQTLLSLIELFRTVLGVVLFLVAARFIYGDMRTRGWASSHPRGELPCCRKHSTVSSNYSTPKTVRQKDKRIGQNVRSQRGRPDPDRYTDERLKREEFYTENGSRTGTYLPFDNGISAGECPGQQSRWDRSILNLYCQNAARGRRIRRCRA